MRGRKRIALVALALLMVIAAVVLGTGKVGRTGLQARLGAFSVPKVHAVRQNSFRPTMIRRQTEPPASHITTVATVTVGNGDTLASIAKRRLGSASRWPALWWVNRSKVKNPNSIHTGEVLRLPGRSVQGSWLARRALAAIPKPPPVKAAAPVGSAPPTPTGPVHVSGSAFEVCVEQAESGGDPRAYNQSSGASGLFGDLLSTWDSLGLGYPGGAYTAPPSVQIQGFWKLYGEDGMAPWTADGCPQKFGYAGIKTAAKITPKVSGGGAGGGGKSSHRCSLACRAWRWARTQRGKWYQWGGVGPSTYDCSGLVYAAFRRFGVYFGRTTYEMLGSGRLVRTDRPTWGTLAFYGSGHVEFWDGRGHTFGAHETGTRIGRVAWSGGWAPSGFYKVRGT